MRFIIGLCVGALCWVLLEAALPLWLRASAPGADTSSGTSPQSADRMPRPSTAAGGALEPPADVLEDVSEDVPMDARVVLRPNAAVGALTPDRVSAEIDTPADVGSAAPSPASVPGIVAEPPGAAAAAVREPAGADALPEASPLPELADAEHPDAFSETYAWWAPDAAVAPEQAQAATGTAPTTDLARVWMPFHSERSAQGFARRLSRALDHPFAVRREGPGRYQVVFDYADADARDALLARIATVTGEGA